MKEKEENHTVNKESKTVHQIIRRTKGDIAYASLRSTLSLIPGAGPIIAEIFSFSVESPLDKRRTKFLEWLANKVNELEEKGLFKKEDMMSDEFLDIVTQALQIVIRNSKKEKIQSLKNSVENSLVGINIEQDLQFVFLNFIDIFSPTHLKILLFFADPAGGMPNNLKIDFPDYRYNHSVESLKTIFSDFDERHDYYGLIVDDLKSKGLLHVGYYGVDGLEGDFTDRVTQIGRQFINFITLNK